VRGATKEDEGVTAQTTRREMQRMATELEIKSVARQQLAQDGVQHVTLRGIARDMGMTAPALYRYFPSLDDLVASMCEDFFEEITEALSAAVVSAGDDGGRAMHAAIRTFRAWAVGHRNEFALMFRHGAENPGDTSSTARFAAVFFDLYLRLWGTQPFEVPELTATSAATCGTIRDFVEESFDLVAAGDHAPPPAALFVFTRTWVRLYGVIGMEVSGQLAFMFDDVTPYFESELEDAATALGIPYVPSDAPA
jgi:AcrR family transcriptional regulator